MLAFTYPLPGAPHLHNRRSVSSKYTWTINAFLTYQTKVSLGKKKKKKLELAILTHCKSFIYNYINLNNC